MLLVPSSLPVVPAHRPKRTGNMTKRQSLASGPVRIPARIRFAGITLGADSPACNRIVVIAILASRNIRQWDVPNWCSPTPMADFVPFRLTFSFPFQLTLFMPFPADSLMPFCADSYTCPSAPAFRADPRQRRVQHPIGHGHLLPAPARAQMRLEVTSRLAMILSLMGMFVSPCSC